MSDIDIASFGNNKYTIKLNHRTGELQLLRYNEVWADGNINYSKMFITILYEHIKLKEENQRLKDGLLDISRTKRSMIDQCMYAKQILTEET